MNTKAFVGLFLAVIVLALLFRFLALDLRPMHHDEANQAVKFGALLEEGEYRYDPEDHHGPSLYYISLPFAWLLSGTTLAALNETVLRLVPAFFGIGMLILFLLIQPSLDRAALIFAGILLAISPVMVFFSRFYIQETLLVFFTLGFMFFVWRYSQKSSTGWALAAGVFAGLMFATKETCIIAFVAVLGAVVLTQRFVPAFKHGLVFLGSALLITFVLFSSFFRNFAGPLDSILSFGTYFQRAGDAGWHAHPWHYYLKMLVFSKFGSGPVWSEGLIVFLALVGCVAAFSRIRREGPGTGLVRFLFFYTLISFFIYSMIQYKTPWNILPFYIGMILLAGYGSLIFIRLFKGRGGQVLVALGILVLLVQLGIQSYRANFRFYADSRNPYVYAHTSTDFMRLVERIHDLKPLHPHGQAMLIKVITGPYETWPLPWYLRQFSQVGYWGEVDDAKDFMNASVIVSSEEKLAALQPYLEGKYQTEYYSLRPEVLLALHIRNDLWERFLMQRSGF